MRKHGPHPRRAELSALSMQVRPLVKAGQFDNVNAALLYLYEQQTGATEWHTYQDWKTRGRYVQKGEKAFLVWATPRHHKAEAAAGDLAALAAMSGTEPEGKAWFPICNLFHAGQTHAIATSSTEPQPHEAEQPEPQPEEHA